MIRSKIFKGYCYMAGVVDLNYCSVRRMRAALRTVPAVENNGYTAQTDLIPHFFHGNLFGAGERKRYGYTGDRDCCAIGCGRRVFQLNAVFQYGYGQRDRKPGLKIGAFCERLCAPGLDERWKSVSASSGVEISLNCPAAKQKIAFQRKGFAPMSLCLTSHHRIST